ncbi:XdhC family protein [Paenibacillus glycinis]|uniref:XdhC/CoxI family protein n=1 Tax=Paenibacillus glycinis TaxID=2697035 RepID=A0ABW9XNT8_9BACL|nr:XdhC/CoxI family protein [Paenibacillus glycinis]NBD24298.1 hypothetical protein [Paenibacillus glycinis]
MNDRWRMLQHMKRHERVPFAMATIIAVDGSAYRRAGAKMLIGADGSHYGTVSAGCLEEDLRHLAEDVIRSRRPLIEVYDLRSEDDLSWGRGAGCNGRVTVYVEPCGWGERAGADGSPVWSRVETHLEQGHRVVCARRLLREGDEHVGGHGAGDAGRGFGDVEGIDEGERSRASQGSSGFGHSAKGNDSVDGEFAEGDGGNDAGRRFGSSKSRGGRAPSGTMPLFYAENGEVFGNLGDPELPVERLVPTFLKLLADGAGIAVVPRPEADGELLLEVYAPRERLYVFGAGPDVELLARLAAELDFGVVVIDPRSGRNNETHFPTVERRIVEHPENFLREHPIPPDSFVLIMTHSFRQDRCVLRELRHAPLRYLGILGSRSRTERLSSPEPLPDGLHAPVGLDIGAEGPEEIAVSIMAELIKRRSGRRGGRETR